MSGVPRIASSSTKGTLKREKMQQDFAARRSSFFLQVQQQIFKKLHPSKLLPKSEEELAAPPSVPTHLPGALWWLQGSEGSRAVYVDFGLQRLLGYKRVFGFGSHGTGTKCLRCGRLVSGICLGHGGGPPSNNVFREDEFHNCCWEAFFSLGPSTFGLDQPLTSRSSKCFRPEDQIYKEPGWQPKGAEDRGRKPEPKKTKGPDVPQEAQGHSRCLRMASPCMSSCARPFEEEIEQCATEETATHFSFARVFAERPESE